MKLFRFVFPLFIVALSLSTSFYLKRAWADEELEIKQNRFMSEPATVRMENIILDKMEDLGSIVGSYKNVVYLTNEDAIYLKMNAPVSVGDRFSIYRDMGSVEIPNTFFKKAGRSIWIKGYAQVTSIESNTIVAKIYDANLDIVKGDKIGPNWDLTLKLAPQEPKNNVRGQILGAAKDTKFIGPFEFAYLNKGSDDGLNLNDRLFVFRTGDGKETLTKDLPEVNIAELVVTHLSAKTATAYCMGATESFGAASTFKAAKSEVKYMGDAPIPTSAK
jgi:hypothetical protein